MFYFLLNFVFIVSVFASKTQAFILSPLQRGVSFLHTDNKPFYRASEGKIKMSSEEGPEMKLDPKETAVVLIEYQNEFTTEGGKLHDAVKEVMDANDMLNKSKKLVDECRAAGCLVAHLPISFEKGHHEISSMPYGILANVKGGEAFTAGEWGAEICDALKPVKGDIVMKGKTGLCGFSSTNLDFILRQHRIHNVILGGFLTNCCVEGTMRAAYERGYKVYTLKDCCAATSMAGHEAALEHTFPMFSIPTTSDVVIDAIKAPVLA